MAGELWCGKTWWSMVGHGAARFGRSGELWHGRLALAW